MSDNNVKVIRKQIKNVIDAKLEGILTQEFILAGFKEIKEHTDKRLDAITKHLVDTLKQIDDRAKDTQAYIVRNSNMVKVEPTEKVETPVLDNS